MKCYTIKEESYKAYSHLIDIFKEEYSEKLVYGGATSQENEELIAREIYTHFGTHYYKCINSLNDMKNIKEYKKLFEGLESINIIDIGCNVGTATYAYIDFCLENILSIDENITFNVVFIEISPIRVKWLEEMFNAYVSEVNQKYKNVNINCHIINEPFPVKTDLIEQKLINASVIVLISNFTHWNEERVLSESINNLFNIEREMYLLNIETNQQIHKVNTIINYMKQYRIYDISGPSIKNNFKYKNLRCSAWKNDNEYPYFKNYYQTNIKEQDLFVYMIDKNRMINSFDKSIYTLSSNMLVDEIEINYFIQNKMNVMDLTRRLLKDNFYNIYNYNHMEFSICKKDGTCRPLVVESGINEILSTIIITSIGFCIDMKQNPDISFGNRLEIIENVPSVRKEFMEQYFKKYIYAQKKVKENSSHKYYCKLDLKSYYTTIDHEKLEQSINTFIRKNSWFNEGEWLKSAIKSYCNRGNKELVKGIPQGLPLSGVLSNMYLSAYDEWLSTNFKDDKVFRYVDDIIIFSNNEIKEENVGKYTKYLTDDLSLEINEKKCEFNKVDNLAFNEFGQKYDIISSMTSQILGSIYSLPSNIYKLYTTNPSEIVYLIHENLKSIGIYIPPSWLAKKLKKKKSIFKGIAINWGKMFGKRFVNKYQWKREFIKNNSKLIINLKLINSYIEEEFINIYDLIIKGADDTLTQRKFKFLFGKLGIFINNELIDSRFFNEVKDKPWLVDLKKLRAYDRLSEEVAKSISNKYSDYCNLVFIWLLGEFGNSKYVNLLNNIFMDSLRESSKELRLINTMACMALMKLKVEDINISYVEEMLEIMLQEGINDYIYIRNCLMLINCIDSRFISGNSKLNELKNINMELYEVLGWLKKNPNQNITKYISPMYDKVGKYLPDEEPSPDEASGYN